jgi:hypothetical protein
MALFQKGKSGNPAGRPKELAEVKAFAREFGREAIETLARLMREGDPRTQVCAAKELLDRGFGRPEQSVDVTGEVIKYVVRLPATQANTSEWVQNHAPKTIEQ